MVCVANETLFKQRLTAGLTTTPDEEEPVNFFKYRINHGYTTITNFFDDDDELNK